MYIQRDHFVTYYKLACTPPPLSHTHVRTLTRVRIYFCSGEKAILKLFAYKQEMNFFV